jgi:hypothetical protein
MNRLRGERAARDVREERRIGCLRYVVNTPESSLLLLEGRSQLRWSTRWLNQYLEDKTHSWIRSFWPFLGFCRWEEESA